MTHIAAVFCATGCLFLAGCKKQELGAAWWENEQERVSLASLLEIKKLRLERVSPSASGEDLPEMEALRVRLKRQKVELELQKEMLLMDIANLEFSLKETVMSTEKDLRAKVCGTTYESFALPSGRQFTKVTVVSVTDEGVLIRHEGGLARLGYGDLSAAQRDLFALTEHKSLQAEKIQAAYVDAYESSIRESDDQRSAQKKADPQVAVMDRRQWAAPAQLPDTSAKKPSPLSQGPRTVGNPYRSRRYRSYSVYRGPTVYYYYREVSPTVQPQPQPAVPAPCSP